MTDRTIAALATPQGIGGIAVIRVSGSDAISLCDKIFKGKKSLLEAESHTVHYGHIVADGKVLDEVLVTVMKAPRTYTAEDVVEISTHGGLVASKLVLDALMRVGVCPAEAGEFTKRAFLNGRIDLSRAEGVIDIINSKTEIEERNALSMSGGGLSREIEDMRSSLVNLAARMQVAIDYPDEDLEDVTLEEIGEIISVNIEKTDKLLKTANHGKILKNGIKTAIVGKPNVGKSSLLNCMAKADRAIVTDIAGTTRDVIEEFVNFEGVPLVLLDTAGIHETEDTVEKIGVERSKRAIEEAELVILMLDLSCEIETEDKELLELTENKKRIIVANKCDIKKETIENAVEISVKTGEGMDRLSEEIRNLYSLGELETGAPIVTNLRHLSALSRVKETLAGAKNAVTGGLPQDLAALDIYSAIDILGEITGDTVSESIVSEIFHNFCVGK